MPRRTLAEELAELATTGPAPGAARPSLIGSSLCDLLPQTSSHIIPWCASRRTTASHLMDQQRSELPQVKLRRSAQFLTFITVPRAADATWRAD